jgi:hypothetical protein
MRCIAMNFLDDAELRAVCGGQGSPLPPINAATNNIAQRQQSRDMLQAMTKLHLELRDSKRTHDDQMQKAMMVMMMDMVKKLRG